MKIRPQGESPSRVADRLVRSLSLKPGASLSEITERVAAVHGKPVLLQPVPDEEIDGTTGLWVETETESIVFYRENDPLLYQLHSICHEFGHIIANHTGCDALQFVDRSTVESVSLGEQIIAARARGELDNPEEILAETVAYALPKLMMARPKQQIRAAFE